MTAAERVAELLREHKAHATISERGEDLVVKDVYNVGVLEAARIFAEGLDTRAIDIRTPHEYEELDEMIEDYGCESCGHGSVLVLRGMASVQLPDAGPRV